MVFQMWCVHISGQHVVVLTHSPSDQFKRFKAEHADCDVSKVSAADKYAGIHKFGGAFYILPCPMQKKEKVCRFTMCGTSFGGHQVYP